MHATRRTAPRGFTLIELLVVVAIIALVSAIALPTILPALNERRVSESARVLQAILAGTRDAAIRANAPRGIRLLPDPVFNGQLGNPLASNRIIPIEPGPDYTEGLVGAVDSTSTGAYAGIYSTYGIKYLIIAESDFSNGVPNNPSNWSLNVRQGDKIRFNDSGVYYTIAGPIGGYPFGPNSNPLPPTNSERTIACFLNNNHVPPLASQPGWIPEFLFLMNGQDDNGNGWIDEGCDGIDNDGDGIIDPGFNGVDDAGFINGIVYAKNGIIDEPAELMISGNALVGYSNAAEFEQEVFLGAQSSSPPNNEAYTIFRRPVVSPGAREVTLPAGVVIDLTTYNVSAASVAPYQVLLPERSRLPVDAFTGYVDVMIDQTGRVIGPGAGTGGGVTYANSPLSSLPFYHFWLTEREAVVAPLYGFQTINNQSIPNPTPTYQQSGTLPYNVLPMPQGTLNYTPPPGVPTPYLTGERRLVTLFTKTGQITSNSIQIFNGADTNAPFYDAQSGTKESQ